MKSISVPLHIRYRDMDMNQHVNNALYFTYMENARSTVLLEDMLKYHDEGLQFVVAEASCKYKKPIILRDKIVCEVSFAPVRPTACRGASLANLCDRHYFNFSKLHFRTLSL